ncbi:hypothetical protein EV421DRAFT_1737464 [Armillaria borealis]|uniref:Uncharacterized protein n=1 Tax=Armillaria borealis TaxID=47425 RepID=A0AA39JE40_9AGAR|nr:hypothetical protein EV421DRAFT_1737464 [Armillaria borealis]
MSLWLLSGLIRTRSTAEALERLQDGYVSEEYVALNDVCEWDPYSRSSLAQARELVTIVGGVRHSIQSGYLVPLEQYMCPAEERIWGRIYRGLWKSRETCFEGPQRLYAGSESYGLPIALNVFFSHPDPNWVLTTGCAPPSLANQGNENTVITLCDELLIHSIYAYLSAYHAPVA